ncbi:Heat shock factor protein 2, partial [Globisporangium polare]
TPTSAAALNELSFNFTMEELDDILFTTSEPDQQQQQHECYASVSVAPTTAFCTAGDERLFDSRFVMSEPLDTSVGFAAPSFPTCSSSSMDTVLFLNETFSKPEIEYWLPC